MPWRTQSPLYEDFKSAMTEFIGTNVFLVIALGSIQSAKLSVAAERGIEQVKNAPPSLDMLVYISASAGIALLATAWMFYRVTGGLFNPCVTIATLLIGDIAIRRAAMYFVAQIAGGITAAAIVDGLMPGPLLVANKLGDGVMRVQAVFVEMIATAILLFAILMLAAEKHKATPFAPIGISMTLFALHLWAVPLTGASMNPARSLGPAVIQGFWKHHWVYWAGPFAGIPLSLAFYAWLKHTGYWTMHPGQTSTRHEDSPEDPVKRAEVDVEKGKRDEQQMV